MYANIETFQMDFTSILQNHGKESLPNNPNTIALFTHVFNLISICSARGLSKAHKYRGLQWRKKKHKGLHEL